MVKEQRESLEVASSNPSQREYFLWILEALGTG